MGIMGIFLIMGTAGFLSSTVVRRFRASAGLGSRVLADAHGFYFSGDGWELQVLAHA